MMSLGCQKIKRQAAGAAARQRKAVFAKRYTKPWQATLGSSVRRKTEVTPASATLASTTLLTLALVRRAMSALSQPKVLVFGYGSNGVAQLRARCANPTLTLRPARLPDHARGSSASGARAGARAASRRWRHQLDSTASAASPCYQ